MYLGLCLRFPEKAGVLQKFRPNSLCVAGSYTQVLCWTRPLGGLGLECVRIVRRKPGSHEISPKLALRRRELYTCHVLDSAFGRPRRLASLIIFRPNSLCVAGSYTHVMCWTRPLGGLGPLCIEGAGPLIPETAIGPHTPQYVYSSFLL